MRHVRSRMLPTLVVLGLVAGLGCQRGANTPEAYRAAAAPIEQGLGRLAAALSEAERASDPMELGRSFDPVLPAARTLRESALALAVGPAMKPAHDELVAAIEAHVALLEGLAPTLGQKSLAASKTAIREAREALDAAVATWRAGL